MEKGKCNPIMLNGYRSNTIEGIRDEMNEKIDYYVHNGYSEVGKDEAEVYKWLNETLDENFIGWHSFRSISKNNVQHQNDFLIFNPKYGYIIIEVKSIDSFKYIDEHFNQLRHQKIDLVDCLDNTNDKRIKEKYYVDGLLLYVGDKNNIDKNNKDKELIENRKKRYNNKFSFFDDCKSGTAAKFCNEFYEKNMHNNNYNYEKVDILCNGYYKNEKSELYADEKNHFKELVGYSDDPTIQRIIDNEKKVKNMTNEQGAAFELIFSQNKRIILLQGDASTGKTFLAKEIAEKFLKENKKCTYVRWNKKLGDMFNDMIKLKKDNLIQCAKDAKEAEKSEPKLLIIDECQDYPNKAIDIMNHHLKNNNLEKVVLIYSKEQNQKGENQFFSELNKFSYNEIFDVTLYKNCRNSPEIKRIIDNPDEELDITFVKDKNEAQECIKNDIINYLKNRIEKKDICILSNTSMPILREEYENIYLIDAFSGCEANIIFFYDDDGDIKDDKIKLHRILTRAKCEIRYYQKLIK